jgi:hypothetical protein
MKTRKRGEALRKLLELCDDLQRIRGKMADPELRRDARSRLRVQSRRKAELLQRDLGGYRFRGPVGKLIRELRLSAEHFQILAMLLQRHLRYEEPGCEGRLILASVYDSAFDALAGMHLLSASSPLRTSGLVVLEEDEERSDDILEARFHLSDEAVTAFREEVTGGVPEDLRGDASTGYSNTREFLVDLRILHNLYRMRSERVFHQDRWDRVHNTNRDPGLGLTRRIESFWNRIQKRLQLTRRADEFPVVKFISDHRLSQQETVLVIHLLFKELYEGIAYADAAELVKLVSASDADLIRNRRLVASSGLLASSDIIQLEPMLENRELTAEVHLSDWAVNAMFGAATKEARIQADERLDWHLYLQNLQDTGTFYKDLDAS